MKKMVFFYLVEVLLKLIKGRVVLIASWDQGESVAKISNVLGVANEEGIQDLIRQEVVMSSRYYVEPKLNGIPSKLYPQILYLYFH